MSCGFKPYLAKSAESTVDINLMSSAVKISLGDIICDSVSTFEREDLNEVDVSPSTPLCESWWSV